MVDPDPRLDSWRQMIEMVLPDRDFERGGVNSACLDLGNATVTEYQPLSFIGIYQHTKKGRHTPPRASKIADLTASWHRASRGPRAQDRAFRWLQVESLTATGGVV
jgi:hypothetical protein